MRLQEPSREGHFPRWTRLLLGFPLQLPEQPNRSHCARTGCLPSYSQSMAMGEAGLESNFMQFLDSCFPSPEQVGCPVRQEEVIVSHHRPGRRWKTGRMIRTQEQSTLKTLGAERLGRRDSSLTRGAVEDLRWREAGREGEGGGDMNKCPDVGMFRDQGTEQVSWVEGSWSKGDMVMFEGSEEQSTLLTYTQSPK